MDNQGRWSQDCFVHLTRVPPASIPVLISQTINTQGFLSKRKWLLITTGLNQSLRQPFSPVRFIQHLQSCFIFSQCHQEAPSMLRDCCLVYIMWMIQWLTPPNHSQPSCYWMYLSPLHSLWTILQAWVSPGGLPQTIFGNIRSSTNTAWNSDSSQTNISWCVVLNHHK